MICGGSRTAASHAARPDPAKASTRLTQRENGMEVSSSGDSVCACGLVACVYIYIYIYIYVRETFLYNVLLWICWGKV